MPWSYAYVGCDPLSYFDPDGEKRSRAGRGKAIKKIENDPKQSRCIRGWLKNERRNAAKGGRATLSKDGKWRREGNKNIRLPPGFDLAHKKGEESCKGHDYGNCVIKDKATHQNETKAQQAKNIFGKIKK